jgi:hypothetical protein
VQTQIEAVLSPSKGGLELNSKPGARRADPDIGLFLTPLLDSGGCCDGVRLAQAGLHHGEVLAFKHQHFIDREGALRMMQIRFIGPYKCTGLLGGRLARLEPGERRMERAACFRLRLSWTMC